MPFKPGQSGNPGGRVKATEAQRKARALRCESQPELVAWALGVVRDEKADMRDRVACFKALLDELPTQVEIDDVTERPEKEMSRAELIALGLGALERLREKP